MKMLMLILLLAMVTLATAKKPPQEPKLPPNDTCGRSTLCLQCCKKMRACLDQCFFWHNDRDMCRARCTEQSCKEGWHECKEQCDLPWCKGRGWDNIPLTISVQGMAGSVNDMCGANDGNGCADQVAGDGEVFNATATYNETIEGTTEE